MKRLLSLVLALTVILGTFMLPTWANDGAGATDSYDVGDYYAIPTDADYVKIGEDVYKVLRTYDDFAAAFPTDGIGAEAGQKFILANDIDCAGQTIEAGQFLFFPGVVLEGNGFSIINVENCPKEGIFTLVIGDTITFKNLTIGSKKAPLTINFHTDGDPDTSVNVGTISGSASANTYWENCHFYASVYSDSHGSIGAVFGSAAIGDLRMTNCTINGAVRSEANEGKGDVALLAGGGSAVFYLDGVKTYGSVYSHNNSGTLIGWCSTSLYMENCENYATVTSESAGKYFAGGLVGNAQQNSTQTLHFTNCVNYGTITGYNAGGMLGQARTLDTVLTNCVNFGLITATNNAGGIVGESSSANWLSAYGFLNVGTIVGGGHAGGAVGWAGASLDGCVNIGSISGGATSGELAGKPYANFFKNCLGLGEVLTGTTGACYSQFYDTKPPQNVENNRYLDTLEGTFSSFAGIEMVTDEATGVNSPAASAKITMAEALQYLNETYSNYDFMVEDGKIVVNQTALRAVQDTEAVDGNFNIRLLGTVNSLNLAKIGFTGSVTYTVDGELQTKELSLDNTGTSLVHKTVLAGTTSISASDLLGSYIYTLKLTDLPATGEVTIQVAPVTVLVGDDAETVVGATTVIHYADGEFVGSVTGEGAITTPVVLEKTTVENTGSTGIQDPDNQGIYAISEGATTYELDGVTYTVVRTYAEFREALQGVVTIKNPGTPFEKKTVEYGALHVILADDINAEGAILNEEEQLLIGKGTIIEGNGYCLYNYAGTNLFTIEADSTVTGKVVVRNFSLGDEKAPLTVISAATPAGLIQNDLAGAAETEWINCNVYANFFATAGSVPAGMWFGRVEGIHTFTNCTINGALSSSHYAGGLIGYVNTGDSIITMNNCTNNAVIYGGNNAGSMIATIKQKASSGKITLINCVNNGTVKGAEAGGFLSNVRTDLVMSGCINNGDVVGTKYAGGLLAWYRTQSDSVSVTASIDNCVNNGNVTSTGLYAGGVSGYVPKTNAGTLTMNVNTFVNTGDIAALTAAGGVVGMVTNASVSVVSGLNTGDLTAAYAAGIFGYIENGTESISIVNSANIGTATQTQASAGNGSASNIVAGLNGTSSTIGATYAFGQVVAIDNIGALVSDDSYPTSALDNEYVEYGATANAMNNGLVGVTAKTVDEAVELLNARYTAYTFANVDGVIVATPVAD